MSFRAQDEEEMGAYWAACSSERVKVGTIYLIENSSYKEDFQFFAEHGVTLDRGFSHYLIAGYNLCVEALTYKPPRFECQEGNSRASCRQWDR